LIGNTTHQSRWGFQFSARFAEMGAQANRLIPVDQNTQVKEAGGVSYIMNTRTGTRAGTADRANTFSVMGLVLDRGLLTAIPVIAGKASGVGN
jgi:hypothetical protein